MSIVIHKIVYTIHARNKGNKARPIYFYEKGKALDHKTEMQNLGFTKVYIKARNMK